MWSIRKPSQEALARFLRRLERSPFSYAEVGQVERPPAGFDQDVRREVIGHGETAWRSAREGIRHWRQFPAGWTTIFPAAPAASPGQTVAMLANALGAWWWSGCRIVEIVDTSTRFAVTYGTLIEHAECGEERFQVERAADGSVWYDIRSFSRPGFWATRLGYPLVRRLQRRFVRDSLAAMRREVATSIDRAGTNLG